jgi:hypothetical protein
MAFRRNRIAVLLFFTFALSLSGLAQNKPEKSITIVLRDGRQKTFSVASGSRIEFGEKDMVISQGGKKESIPVSDIVRMDFKTDGNKSPAFGVNHFVGKWEFGTGAGSNSFFVTLDRDGHAHKSIGASHGTWVVVDSEARISWDDGWKDVIRKVGSKHEKFAYEPGKSLSDDPSNVTYAKSLNSEPI